MRIVLWITATFVASMFTSSAPSATSAPPPTLAASGAVVSSPAPVAAAAPTASARSQDPDDPDAERTGTSITVYSSADPGGFDVQQFLRSDVYRDPNFPWDVPGFGVVKEVRRIMIEPGQTSLRFTDVAAYIDPTTVSFADLDDPATSVLEQNFEFDLVSPERLLARYIDHTVRLTRFDGSVREEIVGVLLSASDGRLVVQVDDSIRMIPEHGTQVTLDALPGGLITRPTLVWKLGRVTPGEHVIRTTYQTGGLTWRADYTLVLAGDDDASGDLAAWVTLLNLSGAAYHDANLKLIAGDVHRVSPQRRSRSGGLGGGGGGLFDDPGFDAKSFFEYHLYTLPRRTDILANSSQQLRLFPTANEIPLEKVLVLDPLHELSGIGWAEGPHAARGMGTVKLPPFQVQLRFRNDEASGLGGALPRGRIRVYKQDPADGTLEFIGEDLIDHTPRNETVTVRVGRAFDLVAERTQLEFSLDTDRRTVVETIRLDLRNRKDVAQKVLVRERLFRWSTSELVAVSPEPQRVRGGVTEWNLELPPDGAAVIEYTVRYTW